MASTNGINGRNGRNGSNGTEGEEEREETFDPEWCEAWGFPLQERVRGSARELEPPPPRLASAARTERLLRAMAPLRPAAATVERVMRVFAREAERALRGLPSSLQMENTHVTDIDTTNEEGVFLALDLGGTNFRVLLLELRDARIARELVQHYTISDALRLGPGDELFSFLAECVDDFLTMHQLREEPLSLGFTFSFPMVQRSLSSGFLVTWTKSFCCSGMEGRDVAQMLQQRLRQRGLRVRVRALLNDTTGTLVAAARALGPRRAALALIFGTGSNGCYLESARRLPAAYLGPDERPSDVVLVDVEWGAFGDNGCTRFLRTPDDLEVDERSLLVRSFTFEKYISGKYLGDLLRASLARLAREGLLAAQPAPASLTTHHLSLFESENERGEVEQTLRTLREAAPEGGDALGAEDALVAQYVARVISNRAAILVSACVATLLRRMRRDKAGVAVDGSVFKKHPRIAALMRTYIPLFAPGLQFTLEAAEDGSGKGSALLAAVGARLHSAPE